MADPVLQGLTCPHCGGTVPIPEGVALVICPYCEQRSVVSGERGVRRYQVPLRATREQAEAAYKAFLSSNAAIAPGLARQAELTETLLVHLPFWTAWGRGTAWVLGQKKEGSGDHTRYVPRERKVVKELVWNAAACDVGEFGVRRIALEGRPLEPYNADGLHRTGMVFEPVGSDRQALELARQAFEDAIRDEAGLERVSQMYARILSPRVGIVSYPLWVMRYRFRGRAFQVAVDGFSGEVLYGKAPGNTLYRAAMLVGGAAAGAFLAIDVPALILSISDSGDNVGLFALGAFVAGLGLMYTGWRRFRFGEHYEYHRYKEKSDGAIRLDGELKQLGGILNQLGKWAQ